MKTRIFGYRNSFHPAWLLLTLVPLVRWWQLWTADHPSNPELVPVLLGGWAVVVAGYLVPLVRGRSVASGPAMVRWMKELRPMLPAGLFCAAVPLCLPVSAGDSSELVNVVWVLFGIGCLFLGAVVFGAEFEQGTMAGLLSQPRSRWSIFGLKMTALGVVLAVATVGFGAAVVTSVSAGGGPGVGWVLLLPLVAFCTAPFFSLLARASLPSVVFAWAVPLALLLILRTVLVLWHRWTHPEEPMPGWPPGFEAIAWVGGVVYLAGCLWGAWWIFRRLEAREGAVLMGWGTGEGNVSHPAGAWLDRRLKRVLPTGAWGALVRKEFRLHSVPWLLAGLTVGLWGLWRLGVWLGNEDLRQAMQFDPKMLVIACVLLGGFTVVMVACCAVSEERQFGVLEWQLTQPLGLWVQWWTKCGVALGLAAFLGGVLPAGLLLVSPGLAYLKMDGAELLQISGVGILAMFGLFLFGLHASSVSRTSVKALISAVMMFGVLGVVGVSAFGSVVAGLTMREERIVASMATAGGGVPGYFPYREELFLLLPVVIGFGALVLAGTVFAMSYRNFRRGNVATRSIVRQWIGLAAVVVGVVVVLGGGFYWMVLLGDRPGRVAERVEFEQVALRPRVPMTSKPGDPVGMDAAMARRYGLDQSPGGAVSAAGALGKSTNATSAPPFRMDPAMMRRYGLIPRDVSEPSESAPVDGAGKPEKKSP